MPRVAGFPALSVITGETEDLRFRGFAGLWKTRPPATPGRVPAPTVRYGRRVRVRARDVTESARARSYYSSKQVEGQGSFRVGWFEFGC